jgi:hypothetical protein
MMKNAASSHDVCAARHMPRLFGRDLHSGAGHVDPPFLPAGKIAE